jgi:uncharacterized protein (DUF885 family)
MPRVGKVRTFLADDTALPMHNVSTEIDRYISWPATAFGYKVGELTVNHLREKAEVELGAEFNVRDFQRCTQAGRCPAGCPGRTGK